MSARLSLGCSNFGEASFANRSALLNLVAQDVIAYSQTSSIIDGLDLAFVAEPQDILPDGVARKARFRGQVEEFVHEKIRIEPV